MNSAQLKTFLVWFRSQTENYWENCRALSLEDFEKRGVGGSSWRQGTKWKRGLSKFEIDLIEADWRLKLPEEFRAFLSILNAPTKKRATFRWSRDAPSKLLQVTDQPSFFDWKTDHQQIRSTLDWPIKGILFDVENNALWSASWGERPKSTALRKERLAELIGSAPTLIPIFGHRYLLDYELPTGRPVLSIYQSDVIIYGEDLATYLVNDFGGLLSDKPAGMAGPPKIDMQKVADIPFWGELIE